MNLNGFYALNEPILITGESGSGKNFLAERIFAEKKKRGLATDIIEVNVASLPEALFERELFGSSRGSFTGSFKDLPGFFECREKEILFLDEIAEISLRAQKKLLTVLDKGLFYRLGETRKRKFKGQIILATNKNLNELVKRGEFREDLFYRIRNFQITLLPLREDLEKLRELTINFEEQSKRQHGKDLNLRTKLEEEIQAYPWRGNIRELKNFIQYVYHFSEDFLVLPCWFKKETSKDFHLKLTYEKALNEFSKNYFKKALNNNQGAINKTAREISLNKVTFISKLKEYDLLDEARRMRSV